MTSYLTDEQVQQALRLEGYEKHPIINAIGRFESQIREFSATYQSLARKEEWTFIKDNFGFFVDSVSEAGKFTLTPLEIIAIWAKVKDIGMPRYDTARYLGLGYAAIPLDEEIWRKVPRHFLQNSDFPDSDTERREDLETISKRLDQVAGSVIDIEEYANGFKGGMTAFVEAIKSGDSKAAAEMQRIQEERRKIPNMDLISSISENFSNGLLPVKFYINELLNE